MAMSPEHIDPHRMVDRLDPGQVRALRAVAQQPLRPRTSFESDPDLAERSEEIQRAGLGR
jgi:hypothetical protein